MKNYRNILRAISMKYAYEVLNEINNLGGRTFKELAATMKLSAYTLRRITNRLSRVGIIKSVQGNSNDKRERVFIIEDQMLLKHINEFIEYFK
jgi:DNA-binding MarR family transcriptional regulator